MLVVGAGPAGLTLACGLLQQGIRTRVVDRAASPATTSRANVLHLRGAEVLDRVGALAPLRERAQSVLQLSLHLERRPIGQLRFGAGLGSRQSPVVLPQSEVESGLRCRLAELGGAVEWDTELLDAEQSTEHVTARLSSGPVRARWVAGCDGARSTVRALAGIDFPGSALPEQWVLADVRADLGVDRGGTLGWLHRGGLLFAMPMRNETDDLWRLIADAPAGETPTSSGSWSSCAASSTSGPQWTVRGSARRCGPRASASTAGWPPSTAAAASCSPATPRTCTARSAVRA